MTRRTHQYSVANFTTNEQFLRTRSSRSTSLKGEVDPKLAMRKIMEEQRQNELYHDDKKRQEIILYRKGIHDRAAVPLPPSNSLDKIMKAKKYADLTAIAVSLLGCTILGLSVLGLLMWILYWEFSPNVDYVYPRKMQTLGEKGIQNPRVPLGLLNMFPLIMGTWCLLGGMFFRNHVLKNYFLLGPWLLAVPIFHVVLSSQIYSRFRNYSPQKAMRRHLGLYGKNEEATSIWDFNQKQFECCGMTSYNDWNMNDEMFFKVPYSCCPGAVPPSVQNRRKLSLARSRKIDRIPDCPPYNLTSNPNMAGNFTIPIVWQRGCLYMVIDHFNKIGAFTITFAVSVLLVTMASMVVARKCFILVRTSKDPAFKYTWCETVGDIFGRRVVLLFQKNNANTDNKKPAGVSGPVNQIPHERGFSVASTATAILPEIVVVPEIVVSSLGTDGREGMRTWTSRSASQ